MVNFMKKDQLVSALCLLYIETSNSGIANLPVQQLKIKEKHTTNYEYK